MEHWIAAVILLEAAVMIFAVLGFIYEDKLRRFERALFGAVLWTLAERFGNAKFGEGKRQ